MYRNGFVSLLKSVVLFDVVKVVSPNDNGPLHLLALDDSRQNPPPDADITSERTLLVNVCPLSSLENYIRF